MTQSPHNGGHAAADTEDLRRRIEDAMEAAKETLDTERRQQFVPFGIPADCYWPASRLYHQQSSMGPETKFRLTVEEIEAFTRRLDYKQYTAAPTIPLPHLAPLAAGIENVIRERHSESSFSRQPVSFHELTKLLELSCGITVQMAIPRRAAPSPGALYAVEAYPIAFSVEGLDPAIYHYSPMKHALERVRAVSGVEVLEPVFQPSLVRQSPPLVIALAVVFPRVQTKYLERGYRFALMEAGHIAQNMLLTATALGMNAAPIGGFWDEPFNNLMEFDTVTEAVVYAVVAGRPNKGASA